MLVNKPDDIEIEDWSKKLPTNHIIVSMIDLNDTKTGETLCAACARENESEMAYSWCANCCEALCKSCDRSHRRSRASSNHKLTDLDEETSKDISQYHADAYCTEHPEKKVEAYCNDHSTICCKTCVILKHRKCDNIESIENAKDAMKNSKELKEFYQDLEMIKISLEILHQNRTDNKQSFENDIAKIRTDVETLFNQLSDKLNKLKASIMSEISIIEEEYQTEMENRIDELKCTISAVENDLALFQANKKHAPTAQFLQTMAKLTKQKELIENYMKEQINNIRDISVSFKASEKLQEMCEYNEKFGQVKISRTLNYTMQHFLNTNINMLSVVPVLTFNVSTEFTVTGIALLENGYVVLSNNNNKKLELRDPQYSTVLSSLSLPGCPWGIKMISDTEGAVAVPVHGLIFINIQNNNILKISEIKAKINEDFAYHQGLYYVGHHDIITVYDSNHRKVFDIPVNSNVSYLSVRDDTSLCYTTFNMLNEGNGVYCAYMDGYSVFTYTHDKLRDSSGITVNNGHIYVCDYVTKTVQQLSHYGKLQRIIFDNLPASPLCISFNTRGDKAVIGCIGRVLSFNLK